MKPMYAEIFILFVISIISLILVWYIFQTEGFETQTLNKFIELQSFNNPNTFFNLNMLQQQVTNDDMEKYNRQGYWSWDEPTKSDYNTQLQRSTIQQEYPAGSYMAADQLLYNQTAMNRILSWKAPEGQFLMNGVSITDESVTENINDEMGTFAMVSGELPKTEYSNSFICNNGVMSKRIGYGRYEPVSNEDLPKLIPGFKFLKGTCNPCSALQETPDYTCPFQLRENPTSSIWKRLWGL